VNDDWKIKQRSLVTKYFPDSTLKIELSRFFGGTGDMTRKVRRAFPKQQSTEYPDHGNTQPAASKETDT
jgi:hypothetical protein